jgi:hypothetical protein
MDNVLQDMVQRLRAIELLLRTQNELLTSVLAEVEQNGRKQTNDLARLRLDRTNMPGKLRVR